MEAKTSSISQGIKSAEADDSEIKLLTTSKPTPLSGNDSIPVLNYVDQLLIKNFQAATFNKFELHQHFDTQQWKQRVEGFFTSTDIRGQIQMKILVSLISDMTLRAKFQSWMAEANHLGAAYDDLFTRAVQMMISNWSNKYRIRTYQPHSPVLLT